MKNRLNTGSLEALQTGETLLVSARKVKGDKIHLEFAEQIKAKAGNLSALSLLNKSDDRFSSNARRAWVTAEPADAEDYFGVDFGPTAPWYASDKGEMLDLDIFNPTMDGVRCRLIIDETIEGTPWQVDNIATAAKRKGKDGDYITHKGAYIFSNATIQLTNIEDTSKLHNFLPADSQIVTTEESQTQEAEEHLML